MSNTLSENDRLRILGITATRGNWQMASVALFLFGTLLAVARAVF